MGAKTSLIISTYNNPESLRKCLWGVECQTFREFEILIADDGSRDDTRDIVRRFAEQTALKVEHVWQEDRGYRKSGILNEAIRRSSGDYLIFTDGDCIPRNDFVLSHTKFARPNYFIAGGSHVNIPPTVHRRFSRQDIESQAVFRVDWLTAAGMDAAPYRFRLTANSTLAKMLNWLTSRSGAFVGCNGSAWKNDILAVNGFDERYTEYGIEDRDLGLRMTFNGVKSARLKYSLVCLHLDHPKNYPSVGVNESRRKYEQARKRKTAWVSEGISATPGAK